jgi:hypothetical protein
MTLEAWAAVAVALVTAVGAGLYCLVWHAAYTEGRHDGRLYEKRRQAQLLAADAERAAKRLASAAAPPWYTAPGVPGPAGNPVALAPPPGQPPATRPAAGPFPPTGRTPLAQGSAPYAPTAPLRARLTVTGEQAAATAAADKLHADTMELRA